MLKLSDININDLAGVDTQVLQDIGTLDKPGHESVLAAIKRRVNFTFAQDVAEAINKSVRFNQQTPQSFGYVGWKKVTMLPISATWSGALLSLPIDNYAYFNLLQVSFIAKTAAFVTIKVFDATIGNELYTKQINAAPGWNHVAVNELLGYTQFTSRFVVLIDRSNIELGVTQTSPTTGCYDCANNNYGDYFVSVNDINDINPSTISSDTGCIALKYSVDCDIEPFICENFSKFTAAYVYLLAIEIAHERLTSLRTNPSTAINVDGVAKEAQYNVEMYNRALATAVANLNFNESYCFSCNQKYKSIYSL